MTIWELGEQLVAFDDKLKAMGLGMDEIKGEMQRNFQTIMVVINHMVKEGNNKERVNGFDYTDEEDAIPPE